MQANAETICNDDGTVTFQYKNDQAKEVLVDVQFAGRKPMQKDAKTGLWTITLGPAAPDMYPYCFDVPHGTIEYVHYYSKSLGGTNNAIVYLPPNYMMNFDKKYPVFYLISGTTDTEEVYYKVGRVNYILDNLLAKKAAKEMIIVLPYGNPTKLLAAPAANGAPQTRFGGDVFSKDLINDLMPFIEKNYRTINNKDHRAIGGFSRGGNQALFNGLSNLDKFSYLCSYSSFTSTDIAGVYDNADDTNKKIRLFWLGVGTDDFLYGNARDYMEFLDKKGIRSVKEFTNDKFGHTWMNAKYFLSKTLPLLFNKKASEEAMKNGEPAPAATGKEQQFTPGVMARLFPRPIISPEYTEDGIIFRFKAPDAQKVELECEILPENLTMDRDSDGVWSVKMSDNLFETFKYCFVVDGMQVTDPSNMFISPDTGFKYSIADNPNSPFNFASQGEIAHGRVSYDLQRNTAFYSSGNMRMGVMPAFIQLIPVEGESVESWFKVGGADAIADRMIADGKTKPCMITVSATDFSQQQGGMQMPGFKMNKLDANDYPTWSQRRRALIKLLLDIKKQPDPEFPAMGGGFGGGFGGND